MAKFVTFLDTDFVSKIGKGGNLNWLRDPTTEYRVTREIYKEIEAGITGTPYQLHQ